MVEQLPPQKKIISGYLKNHDLAEIGFKKFPCQSFADKDLTGHGQGRGQVQVEIMKNFEPRNNDDGLWFSYRLECSLRENLLEHMLVFLSLKTLALYP